MNNQKKVIISVLVAIVVIGGIWYAIAQQNGGTYNTNTTNQVVANSNSANTNSITNVNSSTNSSVNTNTVPAGWVSYNNTEFGFSLAHPPQLFGWEAKLSEAVAKERKDGLVADFGWRTSSMQGSLFVVSVFSKSLSEVVATADQGKITSETKTVDSLTLRKMEWIVPTYGVDGQNYSYIIQNGTYGGDDELKTFEEIVSTLKLK